MLNFLKKGELSTGIQITDDLVRFVSFRISDKKIQTHTFGEEFLSTGTVTNGKITSIDGLVHVLKVLRKKHGFKDVTVVLPEEQSFIFYTNIPNVPAEELPGVIQDHISSYLHLHSKLSLRDLVCEYDIVGETNGNYEMQVTVTPQALVESYIHVFEEAGLDPKILEVGSHMTSRACVRGSEGESCMLVDFGKDHSHISIVSDGTVINSNTLGVGERNVGFTIEKFLNVNAHEAGRIQSKHGVLHTHKEPELLSDIFYELSPLRDYIDRQFVNWHTGGYRGKKERNPIKKIILHGEGAHLKGFGEHLASSTRIPVENANVWTNVPDFQASIPNMHKDDTLRYTTAISAALHKVMG